MAAAKVATREVTKLVFYDLEWTQNEIIQIGAVCEGSDFSQCIRPSGRIDPFVRKKIKLDVRKDHTGQHQVFDLVRKQFLPTVNPREGFERFLTWLESVGKGCNVYMVSHGNADVLVLDRNFARFDLEKRLYKVITKYVDFQKYLAANFKDISHLSLLELVKIFCNSQIFRLHCADEDSKALMSVFTNMHQMRGVSSDLYMKNIEKLKRVYIKSVNIPKNSKEIKEIANHLNPGSRYVLLNNIFGVYNIFLSSPLFNIIEAPENFKFEVSGYCVNHRSERYQTKNAKEETRERTRIELACHIGNAYFLLTHLVQPGAKSPYNLVKKEAAAKRVVLTVGQPLTVMILVTSTNYVKVDDIGLNYDKRPVDINKILTDLQKKQHCGKDEGWTEQPLQNSQANGPSRASEQPRRVNSSHVKSRPVSNNNAVVTETETDPTILSRRQKQIEYCKRTDDYKVYVGEVAKTSRESSMPKTPDMNKKYSRRQWDGAVKRWKTRVHAVGREIAKTSSNNSSTDTSKEDSSNHPEG